MAASEQFINKYSEFKKSGMKLDMSRGKPSPEQFAALEPLLTEITKSSECYSENGLDCRNYGGPDGIPEVKRIFTAMLSLPEKNIIIGGNSSLSLMYDQITRAYCFGIRGEKPWSLIKAKFLCPVPGYDRHFAITERFGIEMIPIPMLSTGPDMDMVEKLAENDETVKGMWSVPKYSNPTGVTYSDETVIRLAKMQPKAKDFCIMWDNAYCIHDLNDTPDTLLDIFAEAKKYGNQDSIYQFASTSKITYSGAGVSCIAASDNNVRDIISEISVRIICQDKLNMLRHARFLPDMASIKKVMELHKSIIAPKFRLCLEYFEKELSGIENLSWTKPNGGYFITLFVPHGKAKQIVSLAAAAGLVLTSAGAGFPYSTDPDDTAIRIAPTFPTLKELEKALELLCICVKIAVLS